MKSKSVDNSQSLSREYAYASHHHLIPLYVLAGINLLAVLVLGCFLTVLWQFNDRDSFVPAANSSIRQLENEYVPAVIQPAEKKQYIVPGSIRFTADDPGHTLRYSYSPEAPLVRTASTFTISTSKTLQDLETPLSLDPDKVHDYFPRMQQCARLYAIRFDPGVTTFGGFVPLKEIQLKDGRTAYIHKNTYCVPSSTQAMNDLDAIEKTILSIESY